MLDQRVNVEVLNQFEKKIRRYTLESKLEVCRKLSHMIDPHMGNKDFLPYTFVNATPPYFQVVRKTIHFFELDYFCNIATVIGEWKGPLSSINEVSDFSRLINLVKSYCPPFIHAKDADHEDPNIDLFFTRLALQQFKYQEHPLIALYRYSYLFDYQSDQMDVRSLFINLFGFSYDDFVKFCTALFILSNNSFSAMTVDQIKREVGKGSYFTPDTIESMVTTLSMTREEAIEKYHAYKSKDDRMRIYNFNPFTMKPILFHDEHVYLPVPQLLFKSITHGFYHMMCFVYKEKFRSDFGKYAYEDYIYHAFLWRGEIYTIIREFDYYIKKQRYDSPDFILVRGNDMVLVEIKANAPKIQLKEADQQTYNDELYKAYGKAVVQCIKKEQHIREGTLTHPQFPEQIDRISYLVITLEDFYIMSNGRMRKLIEEICIQEGVILKPDRDFHIMGTTTLEHFLEADARHLFEFLHTREDQKTLYSIIPWMEINQDNDMNDFRFMKYWEKQINDLAKDLFGREYQVNVGTP